MKPWKLAFFALIGAFTLGPSACTVTSDDDDDGLDDDDDDGDGGTGGVGGTSGTSGTAGNAGTSGTAGNAGTAGTSGSATGTVTQFFGEGSACQQCLDNMDGIASTDSNVDCGVVVDNCGVGGQNCDVFVTCLGQEQQEFDSFSPMNSGDSVTCSMVACGPTLVNDMTSEQLELFTCLVDKCNEPCSIDKPLPEETFAGIEDRCPNLPELDSFLFI